MNTNETRNVAIRAVLHFNKNSAEIIRTINKPITTDLACLNFSFTTIIRGNAMDKNIAVTFGFIEVPVTLKYGLPLSIKCVACNMQIIASKIANVKTVVYRELIIDILENLKTVINEISRHNNKT